jgi:hypothetical protein
VGINTAEPKATLHVEAGASENKGVIIPRITAAEMKTMTTGLGADHHSMMTYLKEQMPTADRTGKLEDVAAPGYYYYDNTTGVQKWKAFGAEQDLRMVGNDNHITQDAGIGGNGTTLGGWKNIGIGKATFAFPNRGYVSGSFNIALGSEIHKLEKVNAGLRGSVNTGIGRNIFESSNGDIIGSFNTGIGTKLYYMDGGGDMAGNYNIGLGYEVYGFQKTGAVFTGSQNIGIGREIYAFYNGDFTGENNIAMGYLTLSTNNGSITGNENIAIGKQAMYSNWGDVSGRKNIALGFKALYSNWSGYTGSNNIGIGEHALYNNGGNTGNQNIAIGYYAGYNSGRGNGNIFLGNREIGADTAGGFDNVVAIGHAITLTSLNSTDNVILLGNNDTTNAPKIGMGTYNPQAKLDVAGGVRIANDASPCSSANEGTIRYDGTNFYGCTSSGWKQLNN